MKNPAVESVAADPVGGKKAVGNAENQMVSWTGNYMAGAGPGLGTAAELPFV